MEIGNSTQKSLGRKTFFLRNTFIEKYKTITPPFGFNGLGELVYQRTYSRLICSKCENHNYEDSYSDLTLENKIKVCSECGGENTFVNEKWYQTIRRVVEGTFSMQKNHIKMYDLGWNEDKGQGSAEEMFDLMFNMKFLPPGRGLWAMGTSITEKGIFAALNNCAFVSTDGMGGAEPTKPFTFLMDMSMLGVGVGFDVKGAGLLQIKEPKKIEETLTYKIPDTREGWVESTKIILDGFFEGFPIPKLDYSLIRKEGEPIKTFGGVACGPEPLIKLHKQIITLFTPLVGKLISSRNIVDIQNMIGACVVAGNVRRTAEIAFGDYNDKDYLKLKDYNWNPIEMKMEGSEVSRAEYGWASNNSIFADLGMDYGDVAAQTGKNGEPGFAWLKNMQDFGRMIEEPNFKDHKVKGGNPCLEQSLESFELCCLVETFPSRHSSISEFQNTLKYAYMYAKTVTLGQTHWAETNRVMLRNRRIGASMSGIVMAIDKFGIDEFKELCNEGYATINKYDEIYSDWLAIPKSIKKTSVKPSGTISLLPGVLPGMHRPENNYYIRRVRLAKNSELVQKCVDAGYKVEENAVDSNGVVVEIPIALEGYKTVDEVSIWEQFSLASFLQHYWADNQVSCTVTFKPDLTVKEEEELKYLEGSSISQGDIVRYKHLLTKKAQSETGDISRCLEYFQYQLKGISLLPKLEGGAYPQMPYEGITKAEYEESMKNIKKIHLEGTSEDSTPEKFCDGEFCEIDTLPGEK